MSKNAKAFRDFLSDRNLKFNEGEEKEVVFFSAEAPIENGPTFRMVMVFAKDDCMVQILTYNYINIGSSSKKGRALEKINELNAQYSFPKFILSENNEIRFEATAMINDNFSPEILFEMLTSMVEILQEEYKPFKKILR